MKEKVYSLGVIVGRFQVLHLGHVDMINQAIELCDQVGIFIGSSQESGTLKNPYAYEKRKELLQILFGDKIKIYPLPDIGVGNVPLWGDYVIKNVVEQFGRKPDAFISGEESRRQSWLDDYPGIHEVYVPKTIDISATKMIQFLINDEESEWQKYIDSKLYSQYAELRELALKSQANLETSSL